MPEGRPLNILVLSTFAGGNANVIRDFLFSFNAHSRHRFYYVFDCRILDDHTDLSPFDVILIFWSVYLLGADLALAVRRRIRGSPAVKVLFLQDEYRDVRPINEVMRDLGVQVMFTCVAEADHETFYPPSLIPTLAATYTVLPGYVPAYLERVHVPVDRPRPIDVAYRSRDLPFHLGDLGREKRIIADRFEAICREHALRADISVREADRIYGRAWGSFLRSSRCVLGTASGASVVDFTGDIRRNCEQYLAEHPEATYEEVKGRFFADVDGKLAIDTVSPRVFEAAALRCAMVHHEGGYSGILEPGRHYICVKRDYSNAEEVVDRIRDDDFCRDIAENAYRDLVASGRYGYRAFIRWFDDRITRHVPGRVRARPASRAAFYARNYVHHRQAIIPRGGGFLMVPTHTLPVQLAHGALLRIPARWRGPLMSRFIDRPQYVVRRAIEAMRLIVSVPGLRAILGAYLRTGAARREMAAWRLVDDLLKIGLARRARGGTLETQRPFSVRLDFDPAAAELRLVSFGISEGSPPALVPPEVEHAVVDGRVQTIVWDHSAVGHDIVYSVQPDTWLRVGLGTGGVYRLEALSAVHRLTRSTTAPALLAILRGETGGRKEQVRPRQARHVEPRARAPRGEP